MSKVICETKRLIVREYTPLDGKALGSFAGKDFIVKWLPDWAGANEWATPWIEGKVMNGYQVDDPKKAMLFYAVVEKQSGRLIGNAGIYSSLENQVAAAYFIDEEYKCKGYITEAMAALIDASFRKYGMEFIIATIQPGNLASIAVAKKLGFHLAKTIMMLDDGQTEELPFHYFRLDNPNE